MATVIKSSDQISIVDLTDGYSVILTNDSFTFLGDTAKAISGGSTTTQVMAMCGAVPKACTVTAADIEIKSGASTIANGSGITVTADNTTTMNSVTAPTVTISIDGTANITSAGTITLPVVIGSGNDAITIVKTFSYGIAFAGNNGTNGTSAVWYTGTKITGTSTTATAFSGSGITSAKVGDMYLNTSTGNTYRCTVAGAASAAKWVYAGSIKGATGDNVQWYSGTGITGTSTTAAAFSGSGVSAAKVGDMYLNTETSNTYRCTTAGAASAAKWVYVNNIKGAQGEQGDTGIVISITSSNGIIFKNSTGSTTLTAHVYQNGAEITGDALSALGSLKWYKGTGTSAVATGAACTVSASSVTNVETYTVKLETTT